MGEKSNFDYRSMDLEKTYGIYAWKCSESGPEGFINTLTKYVEEVLNPEFQKTADAKGLPLATVMTIRRSDLTKLSQQPRRWLGTWNNDPFNKWLTKDKCPPPDGPGGTPIGGFSKQPAKSLFGLSKKPPWLNRTELDSSVTNPYLLNQNGHTHDISGSQAVAVYVQRSWQDRLLSPLISLGHLLGISYTPVNLNGIQTIPFSARLPAMAR